MKPRVRWRWLNWLYAMVHGYYWSACPICGRHYGGHEAADAALFTCSAFSGHLVCWRCGETAGQRSLPALRREGIIRSDYND